MLVRYSFKDLKKNEYIVPLAKTKYRACFARINEFLQSSISISDYKLKIFIRHKDVIRDPSNYKISDEDLLWFVEYVKKKIDLDLKIKKTESKEYIYFEYPMLSNGLNDALLKFYYHVVRLSYESFSNHNNIERLKLIEEKFPNLNIIDQYCILLSRNVVRTYGSKEMIYRLSYRGHALTHYYLLEYLTNDEFIEKLKEFSNDKKLRTTENLYFKIFQKYEHMNLSEENFENYLKKRNVSYEEYKSLCCWE